MDALKVQQTFSASSIPSSAWDDPARILRVGSEGQVVPQPPIPSGSSNRRPTCGAGWRRSCGPRRRWPLVFISLTPQAFRLVHLIERISIISRQAIRT
jgi:hypothetical protein